MRSCKCKLAPVISSLILCCSFLLGCSGLNQPGREDLTGASSLLMDGAAELRIDILSSAGSVSIKYQSDVVVCKDYAKWDGLARVYYQSTFFSQQCNSLCNDISSYKQWRGKWVASDTKSPATLITQWLGNVKGGEGTYFTKPIIPAEYKASLSSLTMECYQVRLKNKEVNWKALCDAHLDSLFGGDWFLQQFQRNDISLFFNTETLLLEGIMITAQSDNGWLEAFISTSSCENFREMDLSELDVSEGLLYEEWSIEK